MSVYVDELRIFPGQKFTLFSRGSCHLTADSDEELHAFAQRLGMRRAWFQPHPLANHYDLTPSRRAFAVRLGALEVSAKEQARRRRAARCG